MTKDFTPYDLAYELKQIGFDEGIPTFYSYPENKLSYTMDGHNQVSVRRNSQFGHAVSAPTFSQAFRWFREKYELNYEIPYAGKQGEYHAFVQDYVYGNNGTNPSVFTYGEAELECLKKLIEIVKQRQ